VFYRLKFEISYEIIHTKYLDRIYYKYTHYKYTKLKKMSETFPLYIIFLDIFCLLLFLRFNNNQNIIRISCIDH